MTDANTRHSEHPIDPIFLERWSPRAFTGEGIAEAELMTLFEAARWAPSSFNSQPSRFIYARRDTPSFAKLLGLLVEFNQAWCKNAAALVVVCSNSVMVPPGKTEEVPSRSHSFDAGSAWMALALQAIRSGWYAHGMVGVDFERAFAELSVPKGFRVEMAIAIGRRGDPATLPEALRARERPNGRLPLSALAMEGGFRA